MARLGADGFPPVTEAREAETRMDVARFICVRTTLFSAGGSQIYSRPRTYFGAMPLGISPLGSIAANSGSVACMSVSKLLGR